MLFQNLFRIPGEISMSGRSTPIAPSASLRQIRSGVGNRDDLRIRRAGKRDLDDAAAVWHESAVGMDGATVSMPTCEQLRRRIDQEIDSGWDLHVVMRDGRIVAMLALRPDEARLDQLFVLPAVQNSGI